VDGDTYTPEIPGFIEVGTYPVYIEASHALYITATAIAYVNITSNGGTGPGPTGPGVKLPGMTVTAQSISVVYDGSPHMIQPAVVNITGAAVSYSTNEATYTTALPPGWTAVGNYTVYVQASHPLYITASATATVTIRNASGGGPGGGGGGGIPLPPAPDDGLTTIGDEETPLAGFIAEHIKYLNGYPDGTVRPDAGITRAEVAAVLFRLLADPQKQIPAASIFSDVEDGMWYSQSIAYMAARAIINGYGNSIFRPDAMITRAELVSLLARLEGTTPPAVNISFTDVADHWAEEAILAAAAKGWIRGYEDGTFRPQREVTRAEVVTILNNMLNRGIDLEDIPADAPSYTDLSTEHWAYTDIIEASAPDHAYIRKENGQEIWQPLGAPPVTGPAIETDAGSGAAA
jgi:hypothetical protein